MLVSHSVLCNTSMLLVILLSDNDNLKITKFVEFSLTNRRTLEIDLSEASEFVLTAAARLAVQSHHC